MKKSGRVIVGGCVVIIVFGLGFLMGIKFDKLQYLRVVDGDTFWVTNLRDKSEWKVRLWGVDAPDTKECYFEEATKILEEELTGKRLTFEKFGRDDYGRILAKVFVDGVSLEETLVATGAAVAYDAKEVHNDLRPSAEYVAALKKIEETAKNAKLGVWSAACDRI